MPKRLRNLVLSLLVVGLGGFVTLNGSAVLAQDATPAVECVETTPEENAKLATDFLKAAEVNDTEAMDSYLAEHVTHNVPGVPNQPGDEDEIAMHQSNAVLFSDYSYTIDRTVAEGNSVVVFFTFNVNAHEIPGATSEEATVEAVLYVEFECGQITEIYQLVDQFGLLMQLGLLPAMAPVATPDA
jgi:predicted ester cyclase